jgi:hypothetical protein
VLGGGHQAAEDHHRARERLGHARAASRLSTARLRPFFTAARFIAMPSHAVTYYREYLPENYYIIIVELPALRSAIRLPIEAPLCICIHVLVLMVPTRADARGRRARRRARAGTRSLVCTREGSLR